MKDHIHTDNNRCCPQRRQNPNQPILVHLQGTDPHYHQHRLHQYRRIHLDLMEIHRCYLHIRRYQYQPIQVGQEEYIKPIFV